MEKKSLKFSIYTNVDIENYEKKLVANRERDFKYKITSVGVHKDDLIFNINNINARDFGSQGQQRTVCLSLKMAEVKIIKEKTGYNPILILDDVLSELDRSRQLYILSSIKDIQTLYPPQELMI